MKAILNGNYIINLDNCTKIWKEIKDGKFFIHFDDVNNTRNSWEYNSEDDMNIVFTQVWNVISPIFGDKECPENATPAESTV